MHSTAILLAILGATNILAQPVDLQKEAAIVDAQTVGKRSVTSTLADSRTSRATKRSAESSDYKLDWTNGGDCAVDNFPGCIGNHDGFVGTRDDSLKSAAEKRWIDPPSAVPTRFGTECSLDTCDMCPTFPGCGDGESTTGKIPALQNWAQPPLHKRDGPADGDLKFKHIWEEPARKTKREAYINPIHVGGVNIGLGPECSIHACEMCPDYPGCESPPIA